MTRPLRRAKRGNDLVATPKRVRRDLWVGFKPYGVGETKPNAYGDIARTIWRNRRNLPYALRILRKGVCDGCALGVAGFHDWTMSGVHLCTTRLQLLERTIEMVRDSGDSWCTTCGELAGWVRTQAAA